MEIRGVHIEDTFAEAFGMRGIKVETPAGIGLALREALAGDQSTLIEVPLELRPGRY